MKVKKIISINENATVECVVDNDDDIFYACFIKEKIRIGSEKVAEKVFSVKIEQGDEHIIKKAKAMIACEERFINDHPQYKKVYMN